MVKFVHASTCLQHLRNLGPFFWPSPVENNPVKTNVFRTGIAKVVGSGGGAVGGGLTLVGGLLTIMSAGAALSVLLVGTGIGLASGVTGGAAAITEKIIKVLAYSCTVHDLAFSRNL